MGLIPLVQKLLDTKVSAGFSWCQPKAIKEERERVVAFETN